MPWVLLFLCASPGAARAEALVKARAFEELYLAFAAVKPSDIPEAERLKVGVALEKGCRALQSGDPVMAFSLGEKAAELEPSADALACAAASGLKAEQRGAAEAWLQQGLAKFPGDDRFLLELGRLQLLENDSAQAEATLKRIPKGSRAHAQAAALLDEAAKRRRAQAASRAEAQAQEQQLARRQASAARGEDPPRGSGKRGAAAPGPSSATSTYESSVDGEGRRLRANAHFRFRYFNGQRDFGQRADYEGRVQAALAEARDASHAILGVSRDSPTDVILYSREEFALHHGAQAAMAIAGFYSQNAIRMNDSAEIDARTQAVLVHEYTHAVVDELASFHSGALPVWLNEGLAEWVEWRSEGHDGPPFAMLKQLQGTARAGQLPSLSSMNQGMLVGQANPPLRYAASAMAVALLIKQGGAEGLLELIRECGTGTPFAKAFEARYGHDTAWLDEQLHSELR